MTEFVSKPSELMKDFLSAGIFIVSVIIMFVSTNGLRTGFRVVNKHVGRMVSATSLPATVKDMLPQELAKLLQSQTRDQYQIVDVREADELQTVALPDKNVIHLPLSSAGTWSTEIMDGKILDNTKPTICLCHHGVRSFRMAAFLSK